MTRKRALQRVVVNCIGIGKGASPNLEIEKYKELKFASNEIKVAIVNYIHDQINYNSHRTSNEQIKALWEGAFI